MKDINKACLGSIEEKTLSTDKKNKAGGEPALILQPEKLPTLSNVRLVGRIALEGHVAGQHHGAERTLPV